MQRLKLKLKDGMRGASLNDLYGIFFEDLNHAADGGLYAEMVENRSFEFEPVDHPGYEETYSWEISDPKAAQVCTKQPLNSNNPHYLEAKTTKDALVIVNEGFNHGMSFQDGQSYRFSLFAASRNKSIIQVFFENEDHEQVSETSMIVVKDDKWQKYELLIRSEQTTVNGKLVVKVLPDANVSLDMISLFPEETFKNRKNGVRKDLGEILEEMHPKFMRFPGGCLVHDGTLDPDDRESMYRWKNSIGPVEQRPTRRNKWGYNQSLGLGFFEYFQLAEDVGAKPLPVLPGGYDPHHKRAVPIDELQPWIDDALDLIEFANGSSDTKWGEIRTKLGHPKPFNLEYLAIGNEEVGQDFFDRYPYFHKAIRERYKNIKLINTSGPFASGSEFRRGWASANHNGSNLVDEHYYMTTDWFLANQHRYDDYDAHGPKVFLGEYATKDNQWYSAVVEASYMIGLERNADKVGLACYAPLLCNVAFPNWKPDLIYFNQHDVSPSLNYYVQKIFMNFQGTYDVPYSIDGLPKPIVKSNEPITGSFGFEADHATIEYENLTFTDLKLGQKQIFGSGHLTDSEKINIDETNTSQYKISFDAIKTGGRVDKGFKLIFGKKENSGHFSWVIGGWENQDSIIEQRNLHNQQSVWDQAQWTMVENTQYHFEIVVKNRHIETYIDNVLMNNAEIKPTVIESLYSNMTFDEKLGKYYLKLVNVTSQSLQLEVDVTKFQDGKYHELFSSPKTKNEIGKPNKLTIQDTSKLKPTVHINPYSVNVLVLQPKSN